MLDTAAGLQQARPQTSRQINKKTEPYRLCNLSDCQVQTSFPLLTVLITLRALCLLISSPLLDFTLMPHVGYSGEGVPLVLTAHSLKVLPLQLVKNYCLPTFLLGEASYPEGLMGFPSLTVSLLYHRG